MTFAPTCALTAPSSQTSSEGETKRGRRVGPSPSLCRTRKSGGGPSCQDNPLSVIQLFGGSGHVDGDIFAAQLAIVKSYAAFDERIERVILADADIGAGIDPGAALADNDIAADHFLTAELLHPKAATG